MRVRMEVKRWSGVIRSKGADGVMFRQQKNFLGDMNQLLCSYM